MEKVRFGVLGAAKIAVEKVIPAMQASERCEIVAIGSRDAARAKAAAQRTGVARSHGSYEDLLADPDVDAIYNPLPNHLHVPWSVRALEAGKHVLCEKPIAMSAVQANELVAAASSHPDRKVMEAFMYRFHPQWQRVWALIAEGRIGALRHVETHFSYFNDDGGNIRNLAECGGGGLMDIGCYCISFARFLFGAEPARVSGIVEIDPRFGVDRVASGTLDFGTGTATFSCSTQLEPYQRTHAFGAEGRIEIEIPCNAPNDRPCRIHVQRGGGAIETIEFEICDQYALQGDAFAAAVIEDRDVPTPLSDAVANMRVIEAVVHSADQGGWVTP